MDSKNLFYFGLEPLKARYTYQLSKEWMTRTFDRYGSLRFIDVEGDFDPNQEIKVGAVLDAIQQKAPPSGSTRSIRLQLMKFPSELGGA